jgi:GT2 family glycosyltransferase
MKNNRQAAAAGPRLKNADGIIEKPLKPMPTLMGEFRYCLSYHFFPFEGLFRRIFGYRQIDWQKITEPAEAEVLSAACLIIRDKVIKSIGVLAEDYFLFSEENDYFYRMRQADFKGYYIPDIEVIHLIGKSRKKRGRLDTEINFFRSRMLFFKKFYGRKFFVFRIIYNLFFSWSRLMERLYMLVKGRTNVSGEVIYSELLQALHKNG